MPPFRPVTLPCCRRCAPQHLARAHAPSRSTACAVRAHASAGPNRVASALRAPVPSSVFPRTHRTSSPAPQRKVSSALFLLSLRAKHCSACSAHPPQRRPAMMARRAHPSTPAPLHASSHQRTPRSLCLSLPTGLSSLPRLQRYSASSSLPISFPLRAALLTSPSPRSPLSQCRRQRACQRHLTTTHRPSSPRAASATRLRTTRRSPAPPRSCASPRVHEHLPPPFSRAPPPPPTPTSAAFTQRRTRPPRARRCHGAPRVRLSRVRLHVAFPSRSVDRSLSREHRRRRGPHHDVATCVPSLSDDDATPPLSNLVPSSSASQTPSSPSAAVAHPSLSSRASSASSPDARRPEVSSRHLSLPSASFPVAFDPPERRKARNGELRRAAAVAPRARRRLPLHASLASLPAA